MLYLSPEVLMNFLTNLSLYPTMAGEHFQIHNVHNTTKCICELKNLFHVSPHPTPPLVEGNYSFPYATFFRKSIPPAEKRLWTISLHKICENTGFHWYVFLPYKDRVYDSVLIRVNSGQWKPLLSHVLCSV